MLGLFNKHYLINVREGLSSWLESRVLRKATAIAVFRFVKKNILYRYSCSKILVVDGGSENKAEFIILCKRMEIRRVTTSTYHPQLNKIVKREHKSVVDALLKRCDNKMYKWTTYLSAIV